MVKILGTRSKNVGIALITQSNSTLGLEFSIRILCEIYCLFVYHPNLL
jgi:hypothetical protein